MFIAEHLFLCIVMLELLQITNLLSSRILWVDSQNFVCILLSQSLVLAIQECIRHQVVQAVLQHDILALCAISLRREQLYNLLVVGLSKTLLTVPAIAFLMNSALRASSSSAYLE